MFVTKPRRVAALSFGRRRNFGALPLASRWVLGGVPRHPSRRALKGKCFSSVRRRVSRARTFAVLLALVSLACFHRPAAAQSSKRVVHKLESPNETLELTVNTSRILTLDQQIPRAQVNNPEILDLTALSPTQVQIMAKKPGVTQVNLWDENEEVHSLDVIVLPDAQELSMLLRSQFPKAALKVIPLANSVIVSGYVDDPGQVAPIIQMAEDYHSKVINHITVGGVQQVLLQVKVLEVSRTKLRTAGFDWGALGGSADSFAVNGVGSLLNTVSNSSGGAATGGATGGASTALGMLQPGTGQNLNFGILNGGSTFFGVLNLLTQKNVAKIISEPTLSTVSGRPASMNVGGEIGIPVAQMLGRTTIQWKQFGTQVDFVPIVLGNGGVRLEVRPRISELDFSIAVLANGVNTPGFKVRQIDTAAELRAGQTLALAGLVEIRRNAGHNGILGLSDLPWIGIPFRKVNDEVDEVEMLILVTPQLVDAMDPGEVPPGGPGYATGLPTNKQLYCKAFIEVPNCEGPNMTGPYPDAQGIFPPVTPEDWNEPIPPGATEIPLQSPGKQPGERQPAGTPAAGPAPHDAQPRPPAPPSLSPPDDSQSRRAAPRRTAAGPSSRRKPAGGSLTVAAPAKSDGPSPSILRNSSNRTKPTSSSAGSPRKKMPGFVGPTGYDLR